MRRDTVSISQSVAAKLIRELRSRGYGATPVNTKGNENSWDINKIWVTSSNRDLCDINCLKIQLHTKMQVTVQKLRPY